MNPSQILFYLSFFICSLTLIGCSNESSFLYEEPSNEQICLQSDKINVEEFNKSDSILSQKLDQINDSIARLCQSIYRDSVSNYPQPLYLDGAEIITADAKGFYAGFKYGWSKGKTIFGKISTAAACATIMSVAMSAAVAVCQLGFEYLDYITSYPKGMRQLTHSLDNSYNAAVIQTYSNNVIKSNPNLTQAGTANEFKVSVLHNLILRDIEETSLNSISYESHNDIEIENVSSGILTPGQLQFFRTPEFVLYYNSLKDISKGLDTFENHFTSSYFSTSDIVIEKYTEGICKYNFFNAEEAYFVTQTLCKEYINVTQELSLDSEVKSYIISSLYIAPLSALYWYPKE